MVSWNADRGDPCRIAKTAVRDDSGAAALVEARDKNGSCGRGARVLAAIDHENMARRALLHGDPLGVVPVAERGDWVQILARWDVAKRECLADHGRLVRAERQRTLDELVADAALEQRGADTRGAD